MEGNFRNELKKELKRRIKGDVSVQVKDDILIVDIQPVGLWTWHFTINILAVEMSTVLSTILVADLISIEYKKYILSEYFYLK